MTSAFDATSNSAEQNSDSVGSRLKTFETLLKGAIALGVFLRFAWAQKRELWYDEVLSVLLSSGQKNAYHLPKNEPIPLQDISQLLNTTPEPSGLVALKDVLKGTLGDPHPPLFYLAQHGWMRLFGNGEGTLRCLMILVSVAALWAAYSVGKRTLGHQGALIFTALLSLNPFFLSHSLNIRMYAPVVLWVLVSAGCLLAIVDTQATITSKETETAFAQTLKSWLLKSWLLRLGMASALTAGLLTHYLFTYWLFALAALALYLDRKRWLQHGLTLGAGVLLFLPWALWGTRQQMHNRRDVLTQISEFVGPLQSAVQHGKGLAQTLANHLLLGHLTTSMMPTGEPIKPTAVAVGCGVIGLLVACIWSLYRRRQYQALTMGLLMGVLPLAIALAIDVVANKYTVGFGWGRSAMVALPGCLFLVAAWLELGTGRWRKRWVGLVLVMYLGVNFVDFGIGNLGGRDRLMFHAVSDRLNGPHSIAPASTLIALDTKAWGHVLRLAYYLDAPKLGDAINLGEIGTNNTQNIELLATDPADMPKAVELALSRKDYEQVLWLHAEYPLWAPPETAEEAEILVSQIESVLQAYYPAQAENAITPPQSLSGTMNLDRFTLHHYRRAASF
ncbi:MAG: glycosyltransferase family 39 protein [Cyanobacteria bacterium P01_D01_bin.105]